MKSLYSTCCGELPSNDDSFDDQQNFSEVSKAHLLPTIVICGPPEVGKSSLFKRYKQCKNKDYNDSEEALNDSAAKT